VLLAILQTQISLKNSSAHAKLNSSRKKTFTKLVGKILAEDVADEESGLVFGKAGEKLTTAMLKRMFRC
jgi:hypothetical protein